MRHLLICTLLLCVLPIPAAAQTTPAQVADWETRLTARDPKVRAAAEAALVQRAGQSLPLLKRLLSRGNQDLDLVTFEVIRRIGPPAIPLLVDLLRDPRVPLRRGAVDVLIDLAPHTESIQAALRRALRDEDSEVARDAARALGALGAKASPSVGALVEALSHEEPHVRIYAAEALASIGAAAAAATGGPGPGRGRSDSRRAVGGVRGARQHRACGALRRAAVDRRAERRIPLRAHLRGRRAGQHRA